MKTVTLIGAGRLGGALAIALSRAGFEIEQLVYRSKRPAADVVSAIQGTPIQVLSHSLRKITSDVVLITTGDNDIEAACAEAAPFLGGNTVVMHASGALSSEILAPAAATGAATGSMHPLISISDAVRGADLLPSAYFCIEGSEKAADAARGIVRALGGRSFTIETVFKPLYHAAAVLASGHIVSLYETAVQTLTNCGLGRQEASEVLFPLLKSTVENLSQQDAAPALTGPFSRFDRQAIERHLDMFDRSGLNDIKRVYIGIGFKALELAERNGAPKADVEGIRETLKLALPESRC